MMIMEIYTSLHISACILLILIYIPFQLYITEEGHHWLQYQFAVSFHKPQQYFYGEYKIWND